MIRTQLIALIYRKTLSLDLACVENRAPATLTSTDVERISARLANIYDVWGCVVEVDTAVWLLWRELYFPTLAPVVITSTCVLLARVIGGLAGVRQRAWIGAVQRRIAATSSALRYLKHLKLSGLADVLVSSLKGLRNSQVKTLIRWRRLQVLMVAVGFVNSALSPVISRSSYAVAFNQGSDILDVEKAFAVSAIFFLIGAPLNRLSEAAGGLLMGVACIDRIREFLVFQGEPNWEKDSISPSEIAIIFSKAVCSGKKK
ncbi:hypothetical protein EYZ11_003074 [Aspergillus tanneri]|uniref:ABC transmembrane type-1 domain-containing protein n=1 Tax=Aspergillus tanneri TaxID=1220188 RepID=A0A4S3JPC0_9EURO|nr:hypothetical protein EYZ11_003074 [Aspergillus tanneri]